MPWVTTKSGKHINTDWFDEDEAKKERQIKANQEEADKLNGVRKNNLDRVSQRVNELAKDPEYNQQLVTKAIKDYTGFDDEQVKAVADALCSSGTFKFCYFHGQDGQIRGRSTPDASKKADIIQSYIDAAPKYKGTIYRGMTLDTKTLSQLKVGTEFDERSYAVSSWSSDEDVGISFATNNANSGKGRKPVVFACTNHKHGTPVKHLSRYQFEEEVLVNNKDVSYRVVGKEQIKGDIKYTLITLEEVE